MSEERITGLVSSITPKEASAEVVLRVGAEQWLVVHVAQADVKSYGIRVGLWVSGDKSGNVASIRPLPIEDCIVLPARGRDPQDASASGRDADCPSR